LSETWLINCWNRRLSLTIQCYWCNIQATYMRLCKVNGENNIGFFVSWIIVRWKVKGHRQWKIWSLEDLSYRLFAAWQLFHTHACSDVVFYNVRGGVQNFPDWCRHLHSSCGSVKHWWMLGLPCLVSQCAKLHVAGWTWAVFTHICLESWKSPQVTYTTPNKCVWKLPTLTQLHATWHTDSLDMVVLPSTGALRYHNCCIDGGTSLEDFGYHLVYLATFMSIILFLFFKDCVKFFLPTAFTLTV
jgi:hypothetical protein